MFDFTSQDMAEWSDEDLAAFYRLRAELRDDWETRPEREGKLYALAEKYGIPGLDGVRSTQTVALAKELRCSGFEISKWWAITPPNWSCPTCERQKPSIARRNANGQLLGQLVEHHDHLRDLLPDLFHEAYCGKPDTTADQLAQRFLERAQPAFTRFSPAIICGDCNTAEAKAKALVRAIKQFSFSPNEMRKFIEPRPNSAVSIGSNALREVYSAALPPFRECVRVAAEFARLAANNVHWFQEVSRTITPDGIRRAADGHAELFGLRHSYHYALLPKDRKRGEHGWISRAPRKSERPPTETEVRFVANVQSPRSWQLVQDDWHCPVCKRTKVEIVRPTSKFPWNFGLFMHRFPDSVGRVVICEDCEQTCRNLNRTARERNLLDPANKLDLTIRDLQRVIIAHPHGMRAIDGRMVEDFLLRHDPVRDEVPDL